MIVRVHSIEEGGAKEELYGRYLQDLFWYNSGKYKNLGSLYGMVEKAVTQWCGSDGDGNLCLDNRQNEFYLYEKVKFEPSIHHIPSPVEADELQRFIPTVLVAFEDPSGDVIKLDIDYSLYQLLYKLNQGYIQTANDRNNYADFISFVNRMLQTGSLTKNIVVRSEHGKKAVVSRGMFGYKFKVVE